MIVLWYVLGKGYIFFSDKFNIVVIGVGGKGWSDICNVWNEGVENVVVFCDVDINCVKNVIEKFFKVKLYKDFWVMLE